MFIVWRDRPVKAKGGGPFLVRDIDFLQNLTCWMPLECKHRGTGRVAHTPLVVHSERRDGKPRQVVLQRFPTIRSCCIADPFNRAAWWHRVDLMIRSWSESFSSDRTFLDFSRDGPDILRKLKAVVPRPTAKGLEAFTAYRLGKEAEYQQQQAVYWDWVREQNERQARQNADEERGRREQAARDFLGGIQDPSCFAVLGLGATASLDEVKARYRDLAKKHHPDRGGSASEFARVQGAYERACEAIARRG